MKETKIITTAGTDFFEAQNLEKFLTIWKTNELPDTG